eukprot:2612696-Pleurochrysis_carterae.AAC.1
MHAHPHIHVRNELHTQFSGLKPHGWNKFSKGNGVVANLSKALTLHTSKKDFKKSPSACVVLVRVLEHP